MNINTINTNGVVLFHGEITKDKDHPGSICILISDEYIKAMQYQKEIRSRGTFYIGGDLLYKLLAELFDYISSLFGRIRLDDVDIHDEEDRTLLFLRKFSRSSERIEQKIKQRMNERIPPANRENFQIHMDSKKDNIQFSRTEEKQSKVFIHVPVTFLYNRLISYVDSMEFCDLKHLDRAVHKSFMMTFSDLNQKVREKKNQIDMSYAIQLAQERIADLEKDNQQLHTKISFFSYQNNLYKRSYFSLKKRYDQMMKKHNFNDDEDLEEI